MPLALFATVLLVAVVAVALVVVVIPEAQEISGGWMVVFQTLPNRVGGELFVKIDRDGHVIKILNGM